MHQTGSSYDPHSGTVKPVKRPWQYVDISEALERAARAHGIPALDFITRLSKAAPGLKLWGCLRVSNEQQRRHLAFHKRFAKEKVSQFGHELLGVTLRVGKGYELAWLADAVKEAKAAGADGLVAIGTNRFIRSAKHPQAKVKRNDLQLLQRITQGMAPIKKREPVSIVRAEPPPRGLFFVFFLCAFDKLSPSLSTSLGSRGPGQALFSA